MVGTETRESVRRARTGPRNGRHSGIDGQGLVEFVLVLPILLLLLLIAVDFGRLFYSYVGLNNAARLAANYGSVNPGAFTGTINKASYDAMVNRETAGLTCPLREVGGHNPPIPTFPSGTGLGAPSVVTFTCDFDLWTPLLDVFFGGTVAVSAESQFPVRTGAIANVGGGVIIPAPGAPVAEFAFSGVSGGTVDGSGNVTGTAPVTLNVVDGSTGAETYEWDWGDGSPKDFTATPPAHTFTGSGSFTVTLTVTNTAGSDTHSRTITLVSSTGAPPVASFFGTPQGTPPNAEGGGSSGLPIRGTRGLRVDFTNESVGATGYSWNFGDGGATSTSANPSRTYADLGVFSVVLTITDPAGGVPATRSSYITIGCLAPTFANTSTSAADATWTGAGFTGNTRFKADGDKGNGSQNPPGSPKNIVRQEGVQGGLLYDPTRNGNNPWSCAYDITLVYTP